MRSKRIHDVRQALWTRLNTPDSSNQTPTYLDFDSALANCAGGYTSTDIASVVCAKTARLMDVPFPLEGLPPSGVMLGAAALAACASSAKVLDVGGAAGAHYLAARSIVPASVRLNWVVVETDTMVDAARRLRHAAEIRFESSFETALDRLGRPDLLLANGVLMCLPDPYSALKTFAASGAQTVVFTRTGLSPNEQTHIVVQESRLSDNGPGELPEGFTDRTIRYPNTFIPRADFEAALGDHYEIRLSAIESPRAWSVGSIDIPQYAFLAARRQN